MTDSWTQEDIDNDMFRHDEPECCDCQFADIDILEGIGHCPCCGRNWVLSGDELRAELQYQADYAEAIEEEMLNGHEEARR